MMFSGYRREASRGTLYGVVIPVARRSMYDVAGPHGMAGFVPIGPDLAYLFYNAQMERSDRPRDEDLADVLKEHLAPFGGLIPGARLPHGWVGWRGRTVSTLDLSSPERFTLLTRVRGAEWVRASETIAAELGIEVAALRIGPGCDVADLYGDFARLSEIGEGGCLLVRPDQHIAWRSPGVVDDPAAALRGVFSQVLDHATDPI